MLIPRPLFSIIVTNLKKNIKINGLIFFSRTERFMN